MPVLRKRKAAKDIERCWKKVKRVKNHGIQGKKFCLDERVINISKC